MNPQFGHIANTSIYELCFFFQKKSRIVVSCLSNEFSVALTKPAIWYNLAKIFHFLSLCKHVFLGVKRWCFIVLVKCCISRIIKRLLISFWLLNYAINGSRKQLCCLLNPSSKLQHCSTTPKLGHHIGVIKYVALKTIDPWP